MYTYAQAETVLARMYGADQEAQRGAFRGRMKHLKRLGIPLQSSPGRGAKILYSQEQLYQWALCLELAEFGIDPTLTVRFIARFWPALRANMTLPETDEDFGDVIFTVNPAVMSKAWLRNVDEQPFRSQFPDFTEIGWGRLSDSEQLVARLKGECRRAMFINISEIARLVETETRNLGLET